MSWNESNLENVFSKQTGMEEIETLFQTTNAVRGLMNGLGEGKLKIAFKSISGLKGATHVGFCKVVVTKTHKFTGNLTEIVWNFAARNEGGTHTEAVCTKWILKYLNKEIGIKFNKDILNSKTKLSLIKDAGKNVIEINNKVKSPITGVEFLWVLQKTPCSEDCNNLINERWPFFIETCGITCTKNFWSAGQ